MQEVYAIMGLAANLNLSLDDINKHWQSARLEDVVRLLPESQRPKVYFCLAAKHEGQWFHVLQSADDQRYGLFINYQPSDIASFQIMLPNGAASRPFSIVCTCCHTLWRADTSDTEYINGLTKPFFDKCRENGIETLVAYNGGVFKDISELPGYGHRLINKTNVEEVRALFPFIRLK